VQVALRNFTPRIVEVEGVIFYLVVRYGLLLLYQKVFFIKEMFPVVINCGLFIGRLIEMFKLTFVNRFCKFYSNTICFSVAFQFVQTSTKMYAVVIFLETDDVEVVANNWLTVNAVSIRCAWPTYRSPDRIARAIREMEVPSDNWLRYDVRILQKYGELPSKMYCFQ